MTVFAGHPQRCPPDVTVLTEPSRPPPSFRKCLFRIVKLHRGGGWGVAQAHGAREVRSQSMDPAAASRPVIQTTRPLLVHVAVTDTWSVDGYGLSGGTPPLPTPVMWPSPPGNSWGRTQHPPGPTPARYLRETHFCCFLNTRFMVVHSTA